MSQYHLYTGDQKPTPIQLKFNFIKDIFMATGIILIVSSFASMPMRFFFGNGRFAPYKLEIALNNALLINSIPGSRSYAMIVMDVSMVGLALILCACLIKRMPAGKKKSKHDSRDTVLK